MLFAFAGGENSSARILVARVRPEFGGMCDASGPGNGGMPFAFAGGGSMVVMPRLCGMCVDSGAELGGMPGFGMLVAGPGAFVGLLLVLGAGPGAFAGAGVVGVSPW